MSEHIAEKRTLSVGRILGALNDGVMYLSIFSVLIIMLLTSSDAFGRYLLHTPITGAVEFTGEYLLVAAVFLALSFTYREGVFVRVTLFVSKMPRGVRFVLDHTIQVTSALVCIILLYGAIVQTQVIYASHTTTNSSLGYELWPAYAIVAVGLALLTLAVMLDLPQVRRGQSAMFKREGELISED